MNRPTMLTATGGGGVIPRLVGARRSRPDRRSMQKTLATAVREPVVRVRIAWPGDGDRIAPVEVRAGGLAAGIAASGRVPGADPRAAEP
jgi:surface antigen